MKSKAKAKSKTKPRPTPVNREASVSASVAAPIDDGSVAVARRVVPEMDSSWLLARLNAERRRVGLRRLVRDRAVSLLAQENSVEMARRGRMVKVPAGDLRPFLHAGGVRQVEFRFLGGSVPTTNQEVFAEFLSRDSSILAVGFNRVGVGVERRTGLLWVTLIFISA